MRGCRGQFVNTVVDSKLPLDYESLGEQPVKNMAVPVRAYSAQLRKSSVPQ